jgi:hypothetical protein
MTQVRTLGNFSGSFMDSVMGMIRPIPSKAKTAVPIRRGYSVGLKRATSAIPLLERTEASFEAI